MSLPHFFLENQVLAAETAEHFGVRLSPDDAQHARVLRLGPGEHIALIDAAQDYFECEVITCDAGGLVVRIAGRLEAAAAGPTVVLVQGLAKGDKMETVIRHATELGVSGFVPLVCQRSIVKLDAKKAAAKTERWRAIAKSAAMQSGQTALPEVSEPQTIEEVCQLLSGATAVLICWEQAPRVARLHAALESALGSTTTLAADARVAVVVGPEGGLAPAEVDCLLACNPRAALVSLGPSILRTETAGIVAPALVLYELGALQ
ncbi:MAG: RsmE family RNA methyltransferase [Raoultibacter sp.]